MRSRGAVGGVFFLFVCSFLWAENASTEAEDALTGDAVGIEAGLPVEMGRGMPWEELREILERNGGSRQKAWGIRFKDSEKESPRFRLEIPWMKFFQEAGAWILRGLLALIIAALILAAGIYAYRRRGSFRSGDLPALSSPKPAGRPPSPQTLLEEARRLYRRGLFRDTWGLCYAASLGALGLRWGLRFPPGATEYRCLALIRRWAGQGRLGPDSAGPTEAAFAALIRHWVAFFYGGIFPPAGALEDALAWVESLCEIPAPVEKPAPPGGARG